LNLQTQVQQESERLNHLRQINDELNSVVKNVIEITLLASDVTRGRLRLREIDEKAKETDLRMRRLNDLFAGDPKSQLIITRTYMQFQKTESDLASARERVAHAHPSFGELGRVVDVTRRQLDADLIGVYNCGLLELADESSRALPAIDKTNTTRQQILLMLKCAVAVSVLVAAGGAAWFSRRLSGRLNQVRMNTVRFAAGQTLMNPLSGNDEIAQLDRAFQLASHQVEQAHRREKAVLDNTDEIICSFDEHLKIQAMNKASMAIIQENSDSMLGQHLAKMFVEKDRPQIVQGLNRQKELQQPFKIETQIERKDGLLIDVSLSASYLEQDKSFYASIHDITAAKALDRLRSEVSAMITHDLKSPLQSLKAYLDMLGQGKLGDLNEKGTRLLPLAERQTARMFDLIQSVLQLESLRSGRAQLAFARVDLTAIVKDSIAELQLLASDKSIEIKEQLDQMETSGESKWIKQIIDNVIANAINYSPPGSVIEVSMVEEKDFNQVIVKDQGPGMTETEKDLIFERFTRLQPAIETHTSGSGLGLTICLELMKLHNGYIEVKSAPSQGSAFVLAFPRLAA
jgi:PAS domain S-box-containing protein